jgi:DNA replication protein DnaC
MKGWAPLFEHGRWTDHGAPYCHEHLKDANDKALSLRLAKFREGFFRMSHWTIDTFPADDEVGRAAKAAALEWHTELSADCNLYIYGGVGSGKSGLAWGLARLQVEDDPWDETRFVNVRQLLARIRRSFGDTEAHDPLDEFAKEVWTLVLDDLGAERVTDWTREWLATLIEERYVNERKTIVTSNYSPSQLARPARPRRPDHR